MTLLDVGCGPGTLTADLARLVEPGQVVGLDSAEDVQAEARSTTASQSNVEIRVGNVYALDFPDGVFDVVHAHQILQHLTDPVAALGEMRRVCRRGGTLAVGEVDYEIMGWWPPDPDLVRWTEVCRAVARSDHHQRHVPGH